MTNGVVTAITITNAGSGYTSAPTVMIGSPPSNAPVFDAFNVLPDATVVLYRNNQEVSRVNLTAGGTVAIADLNGSTQPGQNPIPDGVYVYRVQQIDAAGNPSALSSGLTVTIDHTAPVTPFPPVLEASSDTSKGFDVTSKDNSPSPQNAPVFDVAQIVPNATVILYRAPVVGGTIGTFVQVNEVNSTAGGTVAIADINNGQSLRSDPSRWVVRLRGPAGRHRGQRVADHHAQHDDHHRHRDPAGPVGPAPRPEQRHRGQQQRRHHADHHQRVPDLRHLGGRGARHRPVVPARAGSQHPGPGREPGRTTSSTPLTVMIVDTTSPTPDGTYYYTAEQIDQAGNDEPDQRGNHRWSTIRRSRRRRRPRRSIPRRRRGGTTRRRRA